MNAEFPVLLHYFRPWTELICQNGQNDVTSPSLDVFCMLTHQSAEDIRKAAALSLPNHDHHCDVSVYCKRREGGMFY